MEEASVPHFSNEGLPDSPPPSRSNKKIILIVLGVIVLCCLCLIAVAGLFGLSSLFVANPFAKDPTSTPRAAITVEVRPVETAVRPATPLAPAATKATTTGDGLGVSRAEMMDFFGSDGAMEFEDPFFFGETELMMGYHTWICLEGDCAAVTLLGPEDDLQAVSAAVPTDPDDQTQTMTAVSLLMTLAGHFSGSASDIPYQILEAVQNAQANNRSDEQIFEDNGYVFTISYDADSRIAGLTVSR